MEKQSLESGTILRRKYKVIKVLGAGGFGITYLARDLQLNQTIVIKEYFPWSLVTRDTETGGRCPTILEEKNAARLYQKGKRDFLAEARRMSELFEVQAIAKILDYFEENSTAYLVMEYIIGISLEEYLEQREVPLDFDQAWDMMKPVVRALEKVHGKGMIHRDINPSNLIVLEDGSLKVIDFGAARKYLDNEKTMTILVKRGYAPPEQYSKSEKQGPWTDVYAVCATLYEMITGVRPEPSINRLVNDELYLPSAYGTVITPEEESALAKGLEPDSKNRSRDMKELLQAFDGREEKTGAIKNRGKGWILAISAGVVITALVLGVIGWQIQKSNLKSAACYAGNYGRNTKEYTEFVEFTKKHAISQEELEAENTYNMQRTGAILYTLPPEAVKEWGKPCNAYRLPMKHEKLIESLKKSGYIVKKEKKEEKNTVEIQKYGGILTRFIKIQYYEIQNQIWIKVGYDSVNQDLLYVLLYTTKGDEERLIEPGALILSFLSIEKEESRQKTENDFRENNASYQSKESPGVVYRLGGCAVDWAEMKSEGYGYGYYFSPLQEGNGYYWP